MVAGCSLGDLLIAGVFPGLLLASLFLGYVLVFAWLKPEAAPVAPPEERNIPLKKKLQMLKSLFMPIFIILAVMGTIYTGMATPTEAAGLGCIATVISMTLNGRLNWTGIKGSLYMTMKVTSFIAWLLFGSQAIIAVYTLAGGGDFVKHVITSAPFGKWGAMIAIQIIWIFLGMLIDWIGILFLTVPLFLPIILSMGFDNVWFGVVFCMNMHIAYLSPPFAPSVFILKSVCPDSVSIEDIYKSIMPYLGLTFVALILVLMFPGLSLWLPSKMFGK